MTTARQTRRTTKKNAWRDPFLGTLAATGNVSSAIIAASVSRAFVYEERKRDEAFAAAWDGALDEAADVMEREAWRRAVEGVEKPVFGSLGGRLGSGKIGSVQEYSDTLLIFLLKGARPEKYRDRQETKHTFEPIDWDRVPPEVRDAFIEGKLKIDDVQRLLRAH